MPSPTAALSSLRPDITGMFEEFGLEADRAGFIGPRVLPFFDVPTQAGNSGRIPIESLLGTTDVKRNDRSAYNRVTWKFTPDTYSCEEYGLESVVDQRTRAKYANYFDAEVVTAAIVRDRVLREAEKRVAAAVFNATTFTSYATQITLEWDSNATSTAIPINDVKTACDTIYARTGVWANALIINRAVFNNLRLLDQIMDAITASGAGSPAKQSDITAQMMAQVFGLDEVIVAGGSSNTSAEGQTAAISQIWSSEYAMVTRVCKTNNYTETGLGRTFHWSEDGSTPAGTVESYEEPSVRGGVIRVRHDVDEVIIYPEVGQLLYNVTTI